MIAAILLAAGSSRRFGDANKLLAEVGGEAIIVRTARALALAHIDEIVVVTGPDAPAVTGLIQAAARGGLRPHRLSLRFVANARHAEGIGTSVATGIRALADNAAGALVVQGDMPALPPALIDALVARFEAMDCRPVVFPTTSEGAQMNPVLWPRRCFSDLAALEGDRGAKALIGAEGDRAERVIWPDARAFTDIDTQDALAQFEPLR